jgi:hypothetical protein
MDEKIIKKKSPHHGTRQMGSNTSFCDRDHPDSILDEVR